MVNKLLVDVLNTDNAQDVLKLKSYENLKNFLNERNLKNQNRSWFRTLLSYWDVALLGVINLMFASYLIFFINYYYNNNRAYPLSLNKLADHMHLSGSKFWFYMNNIDDYGREECTVRFPHMINALTRPIENCSMCANLTQIERLAHVSKEEFLSKYAYTAIPVIIEDATVNWTAISVFNFKYFKDLYTKEDEKSRDDEADEIKNTCQFFPYKTDFKELEDVFDLDEEYLSQGSQDFKPWYIGWSNCNPEIANEIRQHYSRPYFLPDDSEMSKTDWIFMGTPGYGAAMHIDDVFYASWQAQITGVKKWTFKPPAECMLKCATLNVDVRPGDIIVFDSNRWFHATEIIGDDLSLTVGSEYD